MYTVVKSLDIIFRYLSMKNNTEKYILLQPILCENIQMVMWENYVQAYQVHNF